MTKIFSHPKEGKEREKEKTHPGSTNRKQNIINLSPLITETKNALLKKIILRLDLKNLMICC